MTFDEFIGAISDQNLVKNAAAKSYLNDLIEELRETYAPVVELEEPFARTIFQIIDNPDVFATISTKEHPLFSNETNLVSAYLHPETIKVVE
ncbi:hypothetical protein WOSG25_290050 [Weissella oryzae SG25]|uniref:Uncharacterized protein n=1 Tax=Weissella oryzae (strain DSM 25784 / JCM 18191 / LMG 30913 / SG25) TaxID=1329250 RepID=A0A069D3T3_WEIOS|nr:hypothetical protein [Weissella oryzae]GAK32071.1 hypothetical protein WOSG25_290050 [Weissella oryzae SG25]